MQKRLAVVLSLTASSLFAVQSSALPTKIQNHGANEIEAYCNKIGGTFRWDSEKYYCVKPGNSGIIVCYWGSNSCYSDRRAASAAGKTAGSNTRNFGSAPQKSPPKTNVTGGAVAAPGHVTTATGAVGGSASVAPSRHIPANAAALGGGAFGGSSSPTMPGVDRANSRKLP